MASHPPAPAAEVGNLPHPLSGFVGRDGAMADVGSALAESRLVTVTGPGGFGKSRLALEVGRRAAGGFGGAAWLVDLVPVTEAGSVGRVLGQAMGVAEEPGRSMLESLVAEIGRRRVLLLVDNCEHVVAGCAAVLGPLLGRCPGAHVLATSRRTLGVEGERVYPLPPLSPSEGRRLFGLRAGDVPGSGEPAVDEICRRLDGMPLAIELAAALTRVFSPAEILARLDDRFALLDAAGSATRSPHATLEAAIGWSYELLAGPARMALRRLAVCAGAFTAETAGRVCGLARREVDSALAALVGASLLAADTHAGPTRYRLLDTIRSYGLARLAEAGEAEATRVRHCALFLALARRAEPELTGRDQLAWLDRLHAEQDELRAALDWSTGGGDPRSGLRLAAALQFFWHLRGSLVEGVAWLRAAIAAADTAADTDTAADRRDRASALWGIGLLATFTGEIDTALPALRDSLALYRELDDAQGVARALSWLGQLSWFGGDLAGARRLLGEAVPLARAASDTWCLADAGGALAFVELFRGAPEDAARAIEECLAVAGGAGDAQGLRFGLGARATLAYRQGRVDAAEEDARACLGVLDVLGGR
jgi:predicted ATPase